MLLDYLGPFMCHSLAEADVPSTIIHYTKTSAQSYQRNMEHLKGIGKNLVRKDKINRNRK